MARRAVLGGGSLNPFGGGGVDFGAFNILNAGNEAYLAFLKVEVAWNAGKATNNEYLSALEKYANAQDANSSDWVSIHARLENARYTVERNVLVSRIENRQATYADLVEYDKGKLAGLVVDSQEYQQRLELYRSSQARLISEEEKKKIDLYQAGKLTTTQLQKWYQDVLNGPTIDNNPDLEESLKDRVSELVTRVQDEKDSRMLSDFNDGRVTTADFLAYATAAKARYAAGTQQAIEWDNRLKDARDNAGETALLYRYNLSQQYAELDRFVKSNSGAGGGGRTSTSTSTRVVLGADGQWKTITSTSTKAVKPSASQVAAHQKLQIEIADAKKQMAEIARKVSGVGGFVQSAQVMKFYTGKLGKLAKGSAEWYAVQGKIDNLNDRIHQEQVYSRQGIKITYPGGGGGGGGGTAAPSGGGGGTGGGNISLEQFMRAIAKQESGGRYDARNSSSGAYGKYQIMPSNWSDWAQKAGLPANAPQTPENQERVAKAAFQRLARSYDNDWSRVAAAWFGGVAGERNRGPNTRRYVAAIMSHLGTTTAAVASSGGGGSTYRPSASGAPVASAPGSRGAPPPSAKSGTGGKSGPLSQITSAHVGGRAGSTQEVINTRATGFPTNLDGRAFEKFYANYERAFESGAESFVDTSSGRPVAYFIGDDALERIERMRQLDNLRVALFDTRAVAYQGTPSELTAMNARNEAYKDVARHEYLIVDTVNPKAGGVGSAKIAAATNPLGAGVALLDKTKAAVQANIAAGIAAYKRGDVTGAYSMFQMAQDLLNSNSYTIQKLAAFAASAEAKIAAITAATGGITPEAALGKDKGGEFQSDLDRLRAFDTELTTLFDGPATETFADLKSHLQLDADGDPVFDDKGVHGQLVLTPDSYFLLKPNGEIELASRPPNYDGGTGTMDFKDDKTVTVRVKSGSNVIQAQAVFEVGHVGSFIDPNDPNHLLPIMGKIVRQKVDGKWVTFYENPMAPGSQQGWSATPFVYQAPAGLKAVPDGKGGTTYTFAMPGARGIYGTKPQGDGWTYSLVFDKASGTYLISRSNPGGLFQDKVQDEFFATLGDADALSLITDAGFVRQGGGSGFDSMDLPVFGFSDPKDYQAWLKSFQPPAIAALGKAKPSYGGWGGPRMGAAFGGLSPDERDERREVVLPVDRDASHPEIENSPTFGGFGGPRLGGVPNVGGIPAGGKRATSREGGLPDLPPMSGGLSPDERDEAGRRAALPPSRPALPPRPSSVAKPVAPPPKGGKRATAPTPKPLPKPPVTPPARRNARKPLPPPVAAKGGSTVRKAF